MTLDLEEKVRKTFLSAALEDIKEHGIYWTGSITKIQRPILEKLLLENGYEVVTHQPKPDYENAFFLEERFNLKDVDRIAVQRAKLR